MAKCADCGSETELHELGVAVCPKCITKRDRFHAVLASLNADLASARDVYREARAQLAAHQAIYRETEHPDGAESARLKNNAKAAEERYREVLGLYGEIVTRNGGESGSSLELNPEPPDA